jgi:hypothetical protein
MNEGNGLTAHWHALLDQLHRHFDAATRSQCLLWVDPAQSDPFEANPLVEQSRVRVPIRHPRFDPLRAPYIVPLDLTRSADADVFRSSVELAWLSWSSEHLNAMQGQPICGWVSAGTSAKILTGHWGRHCHLHIRQGQAKLLRFQDPGVREWLWPELSEAQQRAILGPATQMHLIGRGQQLVGHRCVDSATSQFSPSADEQRGYATLLLTQSQWDQVEDYEILHAAWLIWRNSGAGEVAVGQASGWERPILGAMTQATRLGLRDAPDRELFALHALQLGADFYQLSQLQEIWRKTQVGDFYGSAIEETTGRTADQLAAFIHKPQDYRSESRHG